MANLLNDIESYLIAQHLVTADGTDIFRDYMPDIPDKAVSLYEIVGTSSNISAVYGRHIHIEVREATYAAAHDLCWSLFASLTPEDPILDLTATRWCITNPEQSPVKVDTDSRNRILFGCSVLITTTTD